MYMISLAEAKKIQGLENMSDEDITSLVEEKEGEIEEYCNTTFKPTTNLEKRDASTKIYLKKRPLLGVNTIHVKNIPLTEDTNFYVYPEKNLVEIPDLFDIVQNVPKRSILIDYSFGYVKVPSTVKSVLKDLIRLQVEKDNSKLGLTMKSEGWEDYNYSRGDSPQVIEKDILGRLLKYVESETVDDSDGNVRAYLI